MLALLSSLICPSALCSAFSVHAERCGQILPDNRALCAANARTIKLRVYFSGTHIHKLFLSLCKLVYFVNCCAVIDRTGVIHIAMTSIGIMLLSHHIRLLIFMTSCIMCFVSFQLSIIRCKPCLYSALPNISRTPYEMVLKFLLLEMMSIIIQCCKKKTTKYW